MGQTSAWKNPFKLRLFALGGFTGLISFAIVSLLWPQVGFPLDWLGPPPSPAPDETPAMPLAISSLLYPFLLAIAVVFIGMLAFNWIPSDIVIHLRGTLIALGWTPISGNLQRGSCIFRLGEWELSVSIHVYTPASHQWGSVTLRLLNANPASATDNLKRFQEMGYEIVDTPLPGKIICHTTIPNLPWQVFRISSLTCVKTNTTTFS